jgi:hypothetical protein
MLFTSNCYSQLIKKDIQKPNRIVLKEHGWFTVSLGTTILSSSYFIHYNYDTNGVKESGWVDILNNNRYWFTYYKLGKKTYI